MTMKSYVTPKEFAAQIGVGVNRVRDWCNAPDFPAALEGNRYRIHAARAMEWYEQRVLSRTGIEEPRRKLLRA